jgi:hypothetical protein
MKSFAIRSLACVALASSFAACGQEPSFGDDAKTTRQDLEAGGPKDDDAAPTLPPEEQDLGAATPVEPADEGATTVDATVPPDDAEPLNKCLAKWKDTPFGPKVATYKRLVGISVKGFGLPVNDTEATADPVLVLVYASVNVGGATTMNLMNPNGYYCIVAGVNVDVEATINVHCAAHLADPSVSVNVGTDTDGPTAIVGVDVNSKITVNTERPQGAACIR